MAGCRTLGVGPATSVGGTSCRSASLAIGQDALGTRRVLTRRPGEPKPPTRAPRCSPARGVAQPCAAATPSDSPSCLTPFALAAPKKAGVLLIFLDVDGVLCCNQSGVLETPKLLLLQKVVRQTGAKVVLSTNWRYYAELKRKLIRVLASFGIDCIGDTPNCGPDAQMLRPLEISSWLKAWNMASGRPPIKQFVAVDDRLLTSEVGGDQLKGARVPAPDPAASAVALAKHPTRPSRPGDPLACPCATTTPGIP